jgi:prepilin-type N-terminal cleavage/methylation domain-containing protein
MTDAGSWVKLDPRRRSLAALGFTLIEIAVVLVIVAVLFSAVAIPLATQIQIRRTEETNKVLELSKEALLGFVISNGRLPCPAILVSNGLESFCTAASGTCAGSETTTVQAHGNCSNFYNGYLPAATLGLAPLDLQGMLRDAWATDQNRIRYAVFDANIVMNHTFTATNGMQTATIPSLSGQNYLYICGGGSVTATCNTAPELTKQAPVVLFSLGQNAPTGGVAGSDESKNLDNDKVFVYHVPASAGATGGEFDDIVTWISINTILSKMVAAGRLP